MVLQQTVLVPNYAGTRGSKEEESSSSVGKISPSLLIVHSYHPLVPHPQRVAWSKLSKFEPRFAHFLDIPRKSSFLGSYQESSSLSEILRGLFSKKRESI